MMRRVDVAPADAARSPLAPRSDQQRIAGMSMLELVIGLTILGLLIAASIPSLVGYLNLRQLSLADTQVIADLRAAADRARTQHLLVRVTFVGGSGIYIVDTWSPALGGDRCDASLVPAGQGTWNPAERDRLPPGLTVATVPTINPFVFSCLGTPDDPSTGTSILPAESPLSVTIGNTAGTQTVAVDMGGRVQ